MNLIHKSLGTIVCAMAVLLASCATQPKITLGPDGKPLDSRGKPYNPYEPGTYDHFMAEPEYPKTSKVWKNADLLAQTTPDNSRIVISISKQRGFLMNGDQVAMDYPVSTGKKSRPTPTGEYKILEKVTDKSSNAYGKVFDAEGVLVSGETPADVPEGGKFVGAPMPYWMRLTWDGVGHHIGNVPRYPASHACIRGPRTVMPIVYRKTKLGTPVSVE